MTQVTTVIPADFVPAQTNSNMPVTQQDLERMTERRKLLKDFVNNQLKQGKDSDGDYAVIAGCKKPSLLKPGAEKLCQLFGLGTRIQMTMKEIDHIGNFAMFVYKAEVFHLKSGVVIAECEGSANNKEKKWATRPEWTKNEKGVNEKKQVEAPIYDSLNTLMKMAQKRAEVGAVVKATGASDFFTHDMEDDAPESETPKTAAKDSAPNDLVEVSGPGTMSHKDRLKELGGKWNMNKKAWVFTKPTPVVLEELNSLDGLEVK